MQHRVYYFWQVSINSDNSAPDPLAMLEVKSSSKGFLPPGMTQAQRDAIVSPAEGLIVICTDCGIVNPAALSIYINGSWRMLTGYCTTPVSPASGTHTTTLTSITWNWNSVANATGYKRGTTNSTSAATDMGTATTKTEPGLTCNTGYSRFIWAYNDCGLSPVTGIAKTTSSSSPGNPTAGTHVPGITQIVWNWNTVTSATGYKWNTTNNYASATEMGTDTTKTETGLVCDSTYSRYIWAYGTCGNSVALSLTDSTLGCWVCGQSITDSRDTQVYNTVMIGTQCWLKQNLNIGTMINNAMNQTNNSIIEKYCYSDNAANCAIYGGLYQWHEFMNYTTSGNANPSGRQGICPTGWHIPSDAEWCQLETYLNATVNCTVTGWRGTDAGGKMKEAGTSHWSSPNTGATNSSGFTALPGGYRYPGGGCSFISYSTGLWSAAESSSTNAWRFTQDYTKCWKQSLFQLP